MHIEKQHFRTIWPSSRCQYVSLIDQTKLPFKVEIAKVTSLEMMVHAIKIMQVRGAPLIGVAAAYGMALAMLEDDTDQNIAFAANSLVKARPTAVNLTWAVNRMVHMLQVQEPNQRKRMAWDEAEKMAEEDVVQNQAIGQHGLTLIQAAHTSVINEAAPFNILTHCNAGWLATVDYGTALAPVFMAHDAGINIHVWVDETRPRNQGASLTAWELQQHGIPHTVITDNAGGHLMQQGQVDMVIVGADRVTIKGDVCNKIGTYLKALAAYDNNVPFYVAVPSPTIDWNLKNSTQIDIEERDGDEVAFIQGEAADGRVQTLRILPKKSKVANPAFDVTPARLVTGIITEKGMFKPATLQSNLKS